MWRRELRFVFVQEIELGLRFEGSLSRQDGLNNASTGFCGQEVRENEEESRLLRRRII